MGFLVISFSLTDQSEQSRPTDWISEEHVLYQSRFTLYITIHLQSHKDTYSLIIQNTCLECSHR